MPASVMISAHKDTYLRDIEARAARTYGGAWRVDPTVDGVWQCPINADNFVWRVRKIEGGDEE